MTSLFLFTCRLSTEQTLFTEHLFHTPACDIHEDGLREDLSHILRFYRQKRKSDMESRGSHERGKLEKGHTHKGRSTRSSSSCLDRQRKRTREADSKTEKKAKRVKHDTTEPFIKVNFSSKREGDDLDRKRKKRKNELESDLHRTKRKYVRRNRGSDEKQETLASSKGHYKTQEKGDIKSEIKGKGRRRAEKVVCTKETRSRGVDKNTSERKATTRSLQQTISNVSGKKLRRDEPMSATALRYANDRLKKNTKSIKPSDKTINSRHLGISQLGNKSENSRNVGQKDSITEIEGSEQTRTTRTKGDHERLSYEDFLKLTTSVSVANSHTDKRSCDLVKGKTQVKKEPQFRPPQSFSIVLTGGDSDREEGQRNSQETEPNDTAVKIRYTRFSAKNEKELEGKIASSRTLTHKGSSDETKRLIALNRQGCSSSLLTSSSAINKSVEKDNIGKQNQETGSEGKKSYCPKETRQVLQSQPRKVAKNLDDTKIGGPLPDIKKEHEEGECSISSSESGSSDSDSSEGTSSDSSSPSNDSKCILDNHQEKIREAARSKEPNTKPENIGLAPCDGKSGDDSATQSISSPSYGPVSSSESTLHQIDYKKEKSKMRAPADKRHLESSSVDSTEDYDSETSDVSTDYKSQRCHGSRSSRRSLALRRKDRHRYYPGSSSSSSSEYSIESYERRHPRKSRKANKSEKRGRKRKYVERGRDIGKFPKKSRYKRRYKVDDHYFDSISDSEDTAAEDKYSYERKLHPKERRKIWTRKRARRHREERLPRYSRSPSPVHRKKGRLRSLS